MYDTILEAFSQSNNPSHAAHLLVMDLTRRAEQ